MTFWLIVIHLSATNPPKVDELISYSNLDECIEALDIVERHETLTGVCVAATGGRENKV